MSTTVRQLIQRKPHVFSVAPDATVFEALEVMADKNIGAVLVLDGGRLTGIFSERDYARKVILEGKSSKELAVREIMSSPVHCADPAWSVHDCMAVMSQWRVRHLPVLEADRVIGVVSIGDVVSAVVSEQATTIKDLQHYIASGA
jgi:CBS domain-containing protein